MTNSPLRAFHRLAYSVYPMAAGGLFLLTMAVIAGWSGGSLAQVATYVVIGWLAVGVAYYNDRTDAEVPR